MKKSVIFMVCSAMFASASVQANDAVILEISNQLNTLQQRMDAIQGQLDETLYEIAQLKKESVSQYVDVDERLQGLDENVHALDATLSAVDALIDQRVEKQLEQAMRDLPETQQPLASQRTTSTEKKVENAEKEAETQVKKKVVESPTKKPLDKSATNVKKMQATPAAQATIDTPSVPVIINPPAITPATADVEKQTEKSVTEQRVTEQSATEKASEDTPKPAQSLQEEIEKQAQSVYEKGKAYAVAGEYAQAKKSFAQVVAQYKNTIQAGYAYYWLGQVELALEKPDMNAAKKAFDTVLKDYPDNARVPDVLFAVGQLELVLEHPITAKKRLNRLVEEFPQHYTVEETKKILASLPEIVEE